MFFTVAECGVAIQNTCRVLTAFGASRTLCNRSDYCDRFFDELAPAHGTFSSGPASAVVPYCSGSERVVSG